VRAATADAGSPTASAGSNQAPAAITTTPGITPAKPATASEYSSKILTFEDDAGFIKLNDPLAPARQTPPR